MDLRSGEVGAQTPDVTAYASGAIRELMSRRPGCIVHQPEYAGIDVAALCLTKNNG